MFLEAVLLGLLVGGFRSGRLTNIIDMNIRGWYIILVSLILSLLPIFLNGLDAISSVQVTLLFISMLITMVVVVINLDKKGVWIILIGGLFNIGILLFNGLKMPVKMDGLEAAGLITLLEGITDGSIVNYIASEVSGWMTIFTKFITIPKPYPFPKIMTIGDILMSIGLFVMIMNEMCRPSYYGKGKMIQYSYGTALKRR